LWRKNCQRCIEILMNGYTIILKPLMIAITAGNNSALIVLFS
jgi:hypothetical protein